MFEYDTKNFVCMNFNKNEYYPIIRDEVVLKMPVPNGKWKDEKADGYFGWVPISIIKLTNGTYLYVSRDEYIGGNTFDSEKKIECTLATNDAVIIIDSSLIESIYNGCSMILADVEIPNASNGILFKKTSPALFDMQECKSDIMGDDSYNPSIVMYCWLVDDWMVENISFERVGTFTPTVEKE